MKNTKCNDEKKCTCIEDYYEIDNQCKGLIDANCSENSDCADNNSMCEFNKCQCLQNFYSSADKKECKKYADRKTFTFFIHSKFLIKNKKVNVWLMTFF